MKVKELIEKLKTLNPELNILGYTEAEPLLTDEHLFRLLEIDGVGETEGTITQDNDGELHLKIGKGAESLKLAFINLTIG